MLDKNTWNHLTVCKKSSGSFKIVINKMYIQIIYIWNMYKQDLAFTNLQWLICHKTQPAKNVSLPVYCLWWGEN